MQTALIFSAALLGAWLSCGPLSDAESASASSDPLYTQPYVDIDERRDKLIRSPRIGCDCVRTSGRKRLEPSLDGSKH
jgi:hypothetical protein